MSSSLPLVFLVLLVKYCQTERLRISPVAQQSLISFAYRATVREHFPFKNESIQQLVPVVPPIHTSLQSSSNVRYWIVSGNEDRYFEINTYNGELYLMRQLDRECLPVSAFANRFSLIIQAKYGNQNAQPSTIRVIVEVEDINDNRPRFHSNWQRVSIMENLPIGYNVAQVNASDPDLGDSGQFTFRLNDPIGAFAIHPTTGWISVKNTLLLDRERPGEYGSFPSTQIDIEVTDLNDNAPIFQPTSFYSFTVNATVEVGTVIGQVRALDEDANENGRVIYAIENQTVSDLTSEEHFTPFGIHPRSGHLIVTNAPLTKKSYTVFIEAKDQPKKLSEQRQSLAVAQITITLSESDLTPPEFVGLPYSFRIPAFSPINTTIGTVKVEGFKNPKNVRYGLEYHDKKQVPFTLDSRTGLLRVVNQLRLQDKSLAFNVTATDGHTNSIATTLTVDVELPKNIDNASSFDSQNNQMLSVTENSPTGFIGQLIYPLTYEASRIEFIPVDPKAFAMDYLILLRNGSVYTRRPMDRELIQTNLTLFVTVLDNGYNRDTIHLTVIITDVNDNAPVFSHTRYSGLVSENVAHGTRLQLSQRISASDADDWPNNIVRFSLSGNGSHHFVIDTETAEISVLGASALDRERRSFYNLTVTASDGIYSSKAELDILIDDVNDNPPYISGFVPSTGVEALERSIDRQDFINEGLVTICADGSCTTPIDLKEKEPKIIATGRILSTYNRFQNDVRQFLDGEIGKRTQDDISLIENNLLIRAIQEMTFNSSILIYVPDEFPVNATIGVFQTSDKDGRNSTNPSDRLHFSLRARKSVQDYFTLVRETGSLVLKKPLKSEDVYLIGVQVSDEQGLHSETSIAVQSIQVNKHRPSFNRLLYELFIPEGDYNNSALVSISAVDQDLGKNGRISYWLVSQTQLPFAIEKKTGTLLITRAIDREETEFYRFFVEASDAGFPTLKSRVEVVVYISDINDNAPKFDCLLDGENTETGLRPLITLKLTEGVPSGTEVIQLHATDADADVHTNSNVTYRLGSHQRLFAIHPTSGSIFTTERVKLSPSVPEFNLLVVAEDGGIPRLSTAGVVRIKIVAACQPDPASRRQQTITLEENVPTPIALVNLTSNRPRREMVHLSLLRIEPNSPGAQTLFTLDASKPVLWLTEPLDREVLDAYSVYLRVQRTEFQLETGDDSLNCTRVDEEELVLDIRVIDVNDNPPVFSDISPFVVAVPSIASVRHPVISLLATDADDGSNALIKYSMSVSIEEIKSYEETLQLGELPPFSIGSHNGSISVASPINRLNGHILPHQIIATDRNGSGLSTSLDLIIHILDESHEVALVFGSTQQIVLGEMQNITHTASHVSGMQVWIKSVEPHFEGGNMDSTATDLILYAKSNRSRVFANSDYLIRALKSKWNELEHQLPSRLKLKEIRHPSRHEKTLPIPPGTKFGALDITLTIMGVLLSLCALYIVLRMVLSKVDNKTKNKPSLPSLSMNMACNLAYTRSTSTSSTNATSAQPELIDGVSSHDSSEIHDEIPVTDDHSSNNTPVSSGDGEELQSSSYQPTLITATDCQSDQLLESLGLSQSVSEHMPDETDISNPVSRSDSWVLRQEDDFSVSSVSVLHQDSLKFADQERLPKGERNNAGKAYDFNPLQQSQSTLDLHINGSSVRFRDQIIIQKKQLKKVSEKRRRLPPSTSVTEVHHHRGTSEPTTEFRYDTYDLK